MTQRYLGVEQDLTDAPGDHLGLKLKTDGKPLDDSRTAQPHTHFGKTLLIGGRKGDEGTAKLADHAIAQLIKVNGITRRQVTS